MDLKELRTKSADELNSHLTELHKERFALRMQQATGQLAKSHEVRRVRREIARAKTLLGQSQK
jgi:large subunit ribosomal protein L29